MSPGYKTCNLPGTGQSSSAGQTTENLPSLLLSGQCDQWSCILMGTSAGTNWTNKSSFFFPRMQKEFQ